MIAFFYMDSLIINQILTINTIIYLYYLYLSDYKVFKIIVGLIKTRQKVELIPQ